VAVVIAGVTGPVWALDTVLDDVRIEQKHDDVTGTLSIKRIEIVGANLTKEELAQLFSSTVSDEVRRGLAARLSATRISAPEIVVSVNDGSLTATSVLAENIDRGSIGHLSIAGFSGTFPMEKGGTATVKSGPFVLNGGDLSPLLSGAAPLNLAPTSHMNWTGLEITVPDEDAPSGKPGENLVRITMDSFVADGASDGGTPLKMTAKLDRLRIVPAPGSDTAESMRNAGFEQVDLGLTMAATYDPAARTLALEDYTIKGEQAGALSVQGNFAEMDKAVFSGNNEDKLAALMKGAVSTLKLTYADAGLFDKALALYADQEGKAPAKVKAEWSAMARQFIPLALGGAPGALNIAKAISDFIAKPQTLAITAKAKGGPLRLDELSTIREPSALLQRIDLDAKASAR
jgi:hypothetical protein